jgi:hypothetical protein
MRRRAPHPCPELVDEEAPHGLAGKHAQQNATQAVSSQLLFIESIETLMHSVRASLQPFVHLAVPIALLRVIQSLSDIAKPIRQQWRVVLRLGRNAQLRPARVRHRLVAK